MLIRFHWSGKEINLTADNTTIASTNFSVDKDGNMTCSKANITGGNIKLESTPEAGNPSIRITNPYQTSTYVDITSGILRAYGNGFLHTQFSYNIGILTLRSSSGKESIHAAGISKYIDASQNNLIVINNDNAGGIVCVSLTQTSLESQKKNFEKLENGLDIVKATDIYKYNFKTQQDNDKKHIGFVIGDNYNYSEEITSKNNDAVDIYSMLSVAYKAIQEQQEEIEELKKEIKELKGGK